MYNCVETYTECSVVNTVLALPSKLFKSLAKNLKYINLMNLTIKPVF